MSKQNHTQNKPTGWAPVSADRQALSPRYATAYTKTSGEEQQACLSWEWVLLKATNTNTVVFLIITNSIILIIIFVEFKQ